MNLRRIDPERRKTRRSLRAGVLMQSKKALERGFASSRSDTRQGIAEALDALRLEPLLSGGRGWVFRQVLG